MVSKILVEQRYLVEGDRNFEKRVERKII
jgi:hypothetical protein